MRQRQRQKNVNNAIVGDFTCFIDNSNNNKNNRGVGRPDKASNTMALQDRRHNNDQATNPEYYDK
jgi:hypothetical protein